ncbi:HD domain-containing protein [Candidatus Micrarchaeota archaeon]|nr:HD domain-containing protein [Candidatus Micrarchaeota archaeon]MBD3417364.1 HD domain-containing protein [Candidatus Micrarchaeota archaeon]
MIIKDSIHGNLELSEFEGKVVDSPDFQRLRRIKQLGVTYLVYPGAMHTRFEHSLGTMHVASRICDRIGVEGEEKEKVRLYALLHDIGHAAFSHESEKALSRYFGDHEEVGKKMMAEEELGGLLLEKYSKSEIGKLGSGIEKVIVGGDVGADRMDYLLRDAYHIGVSYGMVDVDRILHTLLLEEGELVVGEGGLEAAESLLVGRFLMFSTVYLHKTVRIGSAMLNRGILRSIEDGMDAEEFLSTDELVLEKMLGTENGGKYAKALLGRNLYKQAYSVEGALVDAEKAEEELSSGCGCEIIVDLPPVLSRPLDIKVKAGGELKGLMEISDLVRSLFLAEEKRKKTLVLCARENREEVKQAAENYSR